MICKRIVTILGIFGFVAFAAGGLSAAKARPYERTVRDAQFAAASAPVLAIVALREQRISIYDTTGAKIEEAPVSSGTTGYETPVGIYSIVQKKEEHHSNLYYDGSMPFMQRITWTGLALHAGQLPGYPASHGCVRLPRRFARQLYWMTSLGMRVIVLRTDIAPVETSQPALFEPRATPRDTTPAAQLAELESIARDRGAEADAARSREKKARRAVAKAAAEAASAARTQHRAKASLARAEASAKAAEHALEKANAPARRAKAELAKTKTLATLEAARTQLETAGLHAQSKKDAVARAKERAVAAARARDIAVEAAEEAKRNLSPVSVFISRKTQRLYIRKANYPVFEAPVMIRDADKPIGTFVFTALGHGETAGDMRWNVLSMYKNATNVEPFARAKRSRGRARRSVPPPPADVTAAQAALERIEVLPEAAERISAVVLPGSSLIISDEGPSIETGKDTDFVVIMSGEPRGGIATRRRQRIRRDEWYDSGFPPWDSPRGRHRSEGGFPFFFSD